MNATDNSRILEIANALAALVPDTDARVETLEEQLDLAQRQITALRLEDEGWRLLAGGSRPEDEGPTLAQIKDMSKLLRPAVAESPLPKQANNLRSSYTFSEKFLIPNLEGATETAGPGRPTAETVSLRGLKAFAQSRTAREYVFGKQAQELISTACSTDGVYLLLGDDKDKTVHAVSLVEIQDVMVNPDHPGEVWGYLRQWNPNPSDKESKPKQLWYYTDRFPGKRETSIGEQNSIPVAQDKTIIDLMVNNQTGWAWGVPDLWAGHVWNRNYLAAIKDGMEVSSLMAWLSAKVKNQSASAGQATGITVGAATRGANVQTYGAGNDIDTYATTGKAYDYDATRPLAALYALAAGVSVVDLLASPSAAGASYGSAQALAPGMRRSIATRRDVIAGWMERVLEWATGMFHQVTPASIEDIDPYRRAQVVTLAWNTGLFHEDEIRPELAYVANLTLKHDKAPEGVLKPNNKESWARNDIDPKDDPSKPKKTAPSPSQGKSDGTGGTGNTSGNDIRTDKVSK